MTGTLLLIWVHFTADFVFQNDKMAINKSSDNWVLTQHVTIYGLFLIPFGIKYAIANMVLHWLTDWASSRATTYLWRKEERHRFFVVIGLDQALHLTALVATVPLMESWL